MNQDSTLLTSGSPFFIIGDRYIVEKELGRGGIGVVFKAKDNKTNNYVVVKVLHDFLANDHWIVEKFTKEAKTIVEKLKGVEGVVSGIEEGLLPNGAAYLIMEYIDGKELKEIIKRDSIGMDLERSANILKQLGETLTKIHKEGVYHRDLKPANIMLTMKNGEEKVKVIDFGIATVKESPDEKTKSTVIAGTPTYMAPEQIIGKPTDKSDIYAMGVIAYEMVTGRIPFNVSGFPSVLAPAKLHEMQEAGIIVKPTQLRPDLPPEVDNLILKALAFNTKERFATAQELGNLLSKALLSAQETVTFVKTTLQKQTTDPKNTVVNETPKTTNKNHLVVIATTAILVIVLGAIAKIITNSSQNISPESLPKNTVNTLATNKLGFALELQEFRDKKYQAPTELVGEKVIFHSKDQIRFNILGQKAGYFYLLNESSNPLPNGTPKYFLLFPSDKEDNYFDANQNILIPKKDDEGLEFGGSTGTEKIWIVWSEKQLSQLEIVRPQTSKKIVTAIENVEQALAIKELLTKYQISKLEENKTTKKMEAIVSKDIMALVVELEHR